MLQVMNGPTACILPSPLSPWTDPELERLRALERQANIEAEKAAIRERLRRMGYPTTPAYPYPYVPLPSPGWVTVSGHTPNPPLSFHEVLRLVPKH